MVAITETAQWEAEINEIATTDVVVGNFDGPVNIQAQQLANRTAFLKQDLNNHKTAIDPYPQYLASTDTPSMAEAQAGVSTAVKAWSALRVKQAIHALAPNPIPAGTRMLFAQALPPTGWTQDTTDTANNRMLRVVNSAGGGVGGSSSPIASHSHTTAGHQLSIAEIPTHYHDLIGSRHVYGSMGNPGNVLVEGTLSTGVTSSVGGNSDHAHGNTGASFTPRYLNLILCTKN